MAKYTRLNRLKYLQMFTLEPSSPEIWVRGKFIKESKQFEAWTLSGNKYKWFDGTLEVNTQ